MKNKSKLAFKRFRPKRSVLIITIPLFLFLSCAQEKEWEQIFNGSNLEGWVVPKGNSGWSVIDGVIDCDPRYVAEGVMEKQLWTIKDYGDFMMRVDWRIKDIPYIGRAALIRPDGTIQKNAEGEDIYVIMPISDSGILLRGIGKSQINIWTWPVGSGEIYGYRNDPEMPPEVRAGATPKMMADNHIGEWNTFEITMKGERLTVVLNGHTVIENALLPGVPERGPIALQHHGGFRDGEYTGNPSLVQFRNIYIKEL